MCSSVDQAGLSEAVRQAMQVSTKAALLVRNGEQEGEAYPAPEPGLIQQLSKGNVPGSSCRPHSKVASSLQTHTITVTAGR